MSSALALVREQLQATRPTFEEMNLNQLSFNKEMEYAIQIFEGNDYLLKMNPQSIKNCLVNIALSGLSLNPVLKECYLVPRKGKCCVDPSYMGLVKVVTNTGSVTDIVCRVVYSNDIFDIEAGSHGYVKHKPNLTATDIGKPIFVYSIATLPSGKENIDYMRWSEVMGIRARSESVKKEKQSPWDTDENEMAKKTMVKRHWKLLPKTERGIMAANAIDLDNQVNGIDFKQEQSAAKTADQAASTPKAAEIALATEDDFNALIEWLDNPELPDTVFGTINKKAMRTAVEKKYNAGQLAKDKAEEYINGLRQAIDEVKAGKDGKP